MQTALDVTLHGGQSSWMSVLGWVVSGGLTLAGVMFAQWRSDKRESAKAEDQHTRDTAREDQLWHRENERWDREMQRWHQEQRARYRERQLQLYNQFFVPLSKLLPILDLLDGSVFGDEDVADLVPSIRDQVMGQDWDVRVSEAQAVLGEIELISPPDLHKAASEAIRAANNVSVLIRLWKDGRPTKGLREQATLAKSSGRNCMAMMRVELGLDPPPSPGELHDGSGIQSNLK